jgi:hypothetical protein
MARTTYNLYTLSVPDEGYYNLYTLSVPDEGYYNLYTLSVPDEGHFRNASCALNLMSTLLLQTINHVRQRVKL